MKQCPEPECCSKLLVSGIAFCWADFHAFRTPFCLLTFFVVQVYRSAVSHHISEKDISDGSGRCGTESEDEPAESEEIQDCQGHPEKGEGGPGQGGGASR